MDLLRPQYGQAAHLDSILEIKPMRGALKHEPKLLSTGKLQKRNVDKDQLKEALNRVDHELLEQVLNL